jgi:hypothetical protein
MMHACLALLALGLAGCLRATAEAIGHGVLGQLWLVRRIKSLADRLTAFGFSKRGK